jgi:tetratricopeptide (TPR) repeat protein
MLNDFQLADKLAQKSKYGEAMLDDESDSEELEDEEIQQAMAEDGAEMTEKEKKKLADKKKKEAKEKREKDKGDYKKKLKDAAKSGQKADQSWKLECEVIYADALLVRSVVQLQLSYYMKGAYNLKTTWGCYYALIQEVEKDTENLIPYEVKMNIKYGTGLFYCYLVLVPSGLMKVLSAIGFIADSVKGEEYLTEVLNSGTVRAPFAALVLCTYYLFLPTGLGDVKATLSKAKIVLDKMNEDYPENCNFWGYTNFYHRKLGNCKPALESIEKSLKNAEKGGQSPVLLLYLRADTLFMDQQWAEARDKYKELLEIIEDSGQKFAYTGQIALSLAGSYVMLGEFDTAFTWVKRVPSMYNNLSKQDANSPKIANKMTANPAMLPLLGVYILYINRDLAHMHEEDVDRLQASLEKICEGRDLSSHKEVAGINNLFLGVMHKGCGHWDKGMGYLRASVENEKKLPSDSMVPPFAYYEMGEMEFRAGNMEKAKELFEKGQTFKGDGNETLQNRYGIAMKQLKKAMKDRDDKAAGVQ